MSAPLTYFARKFADEGNAPLDDSYQDRLNALDQKLKAIDAKKAAEVKEDGAAQKFDNMGLAYRMVIDLCAGVVFGFFVGLGIDKVFGTTPWGLIIMIFIGLAAGFRIMLQSAKKFEAGQATKKEDE